MSSYPISLETIVEGDGVNPGKFDLTDGTNTVVIQCPTTISSSYTFRLPPSLGAIGTALGMINSTDTDWATVSVGSNIWLFTDEKPSGTDGGTFASAAWLPRDLNTTTLSPSAGTDVQLAVAPAGANQLLIQPGTYFVFGFTQMNNNSQFKSALWDDDASSILIIGTSERNVANTGCDSYVIGFITITVQTVLSYRIHVAPSDPLNGGKAVGILGVPEIYTQLSFSSL